jgi:hypothetical protein
MSCNGDIENCLDSLCHKDWLCRARYPVNISVRLAAAGIDSPKSSNVDFFKAAPRVTANKSRQAYLGRAVKDLKLHKKLWAASKLTCWLCKEPIMEEDFSLDHYLPKSLGGKNNIDNLKPAHRRCNYARGNWLVTSEAFIAVFPEADSQIYLPLYENVSNLPK